MKRLIVAALAAAIVMPTTLQHAGRGRGLAAGIIAGAIIAHNYRHAYRPRYYAPRPRVYHHHHYHTQPGYTPAPPVHTQPLPAPTR